MSRTCACGTAAAAAASVAAEAARSGNMRRASGVGLFRVIDPVPTGGRYRRWCGARQCPGRRGGLQGRLGWPGWPRWCACRCSRAPSSWAWRARRTTPSPAPRRWYALAAVRRAPPLSTGGPQPAASPRGLSSSSSSALPRSPNSSQQQLAVLPFLTCWRRRGAW